MDGTTDTASGAVTHDAVIQELQKHATAAEGQFDEILTKMKDSNMTDLTTLAALRGNGNQDGFGMGGGLMGGLLLGALLRNGGGGLFGGNGGDGAAAAAMLNPQQAQANMSLMAGVGDIKQAVAVNTAQMENSNSVQSLGLTNTINNATGAVAGSVAGLKDVVNSNAVALMQQLNTVNTNIMQGNNIVTSAISNDGEKTRSLITMQYEATLNRQLSDANSAIIELRGDQRLQERARGIEVTTTNNINQVQSQQQQQQQFQALAGLVSNLANDLQYIRASNQAINIGAGTQTANPTNTTTATRVN